MLLKIYFFKTAFSIFRDIRDSKLKQKWWIQWYRGNILKQFNFVQILIFWTYQKNYSSKIMFLILRYRLVVVFPEELVPKKVKNVGFSGLKLPKFKVY